MNVKKKPLVSIITPCYNGEEYINRFLDSILNQSYEKIELIFINDGSTDKTEEIVLSYQRKFEAKGIIFKYIYQKNKGVAAALNRGLQIFKGDYISWPDSDDTLEKNNISIKVDFLEKNREYGIVLCKSKIIDEYTMKTIGFLERSPNKSTDKLFHDLILERNAIFAGGAYMVRTSAFLKAIPERNIFENRGGQNYQILLPILYEYKCGYIDKYLYNYFVRKDSHSHSISSIQSALKRCDEHEDILINTIKKIIPMKDEEKKNYIQLVTLKYTRKRLRLSAKYRNNDLLGKYFKELNSKYYLRINDRFIYLKGKSRFIEIFFIIIKTPYYLLRLFKGKKYDRSRIKK
jgi:glycosyltransferase involved in cell wall biosynthesis